jgi:hypothetical protein
MATEADLTADPDEAIAFCRQLIEDLEELPERAEDFVAGVQPKVESMEEWIDTNSACTERMAEALLNMRRGTDKWMR